MGRDSDFWGIVAHVSQSPMMVTATAFAVLSLVVLVLVKVSGVNQTQLSRIGRSQALYNRPTTEKTPIPRGEQPAIITPQPPTFKWQDTIPIKLRPFKPIYYITMALRSSTPSDLILMDHNYVDHIRERQQIMAAHPQHVLGCIPGPTPADPSNALYNGSVGGVEAVRELYAYLLREYLPTRYPTLFTVSNDGTFKNEITGATFPSELPPLAADDTEAAVAALKILGETVEDDLLLLQQDATPLPQSSPSPSQCPPDITQAKKNGGIAIEQVGLHRLVALVGCNANGFDPGEKLGHVLKDIHKPVPSYEKIERSMERFFSRVEVGKATNRSNWSITTNSELLNLAGNHIKSEEEAKETKEIDEIDPDKTYVRTELQTMIRLPRTRAILFSFKTLMYPLSEVKEEGLGPELADAIEGLKTGNAPGMWVYKGAVRYVKLPPSRKAWDLSMRPSRRVRWE